MLNCVGQKGGKLSKLRKSNFTVEEIACDASRRGRMGGRHATTSDSRQGLPHVLYTDFGFSIFFILRNKRKMTKRSHFGDPSPLSLQNCEEENRGASATHYYRYVKKSRIIGCVIPHGDSQCGITQPILRLFLAYLYIRIPAFCYPRRILSAHIAVFMKLECQTASEFQVSKMPKAKPPRTNSSADSLERTAHAST